MLTQEQLKAIPAELRDRRSWVLWRSDPDPQKPGKVRKVPYDPQNPALRASSIDRATWASFEMAVAACREYSFEGVGFVFEEGGPYVGIDFDDCLDPETGAVEEWAGKWLEALDSYVEISPSGNGVKCIVRAKKLGERCEQGNLGILGATVRHPEHPPEIAIFDRARFFTITGNVLHNGGIQARQDELNQLYGAIFPAPKDEAKASVGHTCENALSNAELLRLVFASSDGEKCSRLWVGDASPYPSASEADAALCRFLAFWTAKNAARMEQLFSLSVLGQRDKWKNRPDYRKKTIDFAIQQTERVWNDNETQGLFDTAEEFETTADATFSISGFLQDDAVNALAGLSGQGKTWIALNIVAELLFGPGKLWNYFEVPERASKIVYLIPEASRATFKTRLKATGLYDEIGKRLFVRTLSKGPTLSLGDPAILRAVKGAHVFCDTAVRFMQAVDENSASAAAQGLSNDFFALQRADAKTVVPLFHSPKEFAGRNVMNLEGMIRGSSEFGAVVASAWGIRQIDKGSNTIHVENIKARDFQPCGSFQLTGRPHIDREGRFYMCSAPGTCGLLADYVHARHQGGASQRVKDAKQTNVALLRQMLASDPKLSSQQLVKQFAALRIRIGDSAIRKYRSELGL